MSPKVVAPKAPTGGLVRMVSEEDQRLIGKSKEMRIGAGTGLEKVAVRRIQARAS